MNAITSLPLPAPPGSLVPPQSPGAASAAAGAPFKDMLLAALDQVNSMQLQADQAVQQLTIGEGANPAEVLTTLQKADMAFKLMLQIHDKLAVACQEINNIRI